ncbi:hypothetical protein MPNT_30152 [Candidatus Methylacidithermus pantelleriae]|uniref:Uncharacterized protein n=1 Tax=Candidatus Methylacidithermus pantelleriae TaxID=2744239 RepID=A0A8J2BU69_9BACT|nr:hypothetical protein MPNT_30152 [Candidatus Methylacidithermus pantelleriae]
MGQNQARIRGSPLLDKLSRTLCTEALRNIALLAWTNSPPFSWIEVRARFLWWSLWLSGKRDRSRRDSWPQHFE